MKVYLIRHGQACFGSSDYDRLSETGRLQASVTARFLKSAGQEFDLICSGTMKRQRQTADEFTEKFYSPGNNPEPVLELESFNEHDTEGIFRAIVPELVNREPEFAFNPEELFADRKEFQRVYGRVMNAWISGEFGEPAWETFGHFCQRVNDVLGYVVESCGAKGSAAVFTSGGPVAALASSALGLGGDRYLSLENTLFNCSITVIEAVHGRLRLVSFNGFNHLADEGKKLLTYR